LCTEVHYRNVFNVPLVIIIIIIIIIIIYTEVLSVITGTTGTISALLRKFPKNILGKYDIKELQKTNILGNAHVLRKVLV